MSYPVVVEPSEHGSVTASSDWAVVGSEVRLTVTPDEGWRLGSLSAVDSSGAQLALRSLGGGKYAFTMPGGKVTVSAVFVRGRGPRLHGRGPGRVVLQRRGLRERKRPHERRGHRHIRPRRQPDPRNGLDHPGPHRGRGHRGRRDLVCQGPRLGHGDRRLRRHGRHGRHHARAARNHALAQPRRAGRGLPAHGPRRGQHQLLGLRGHALGPSAKASSRATRTASSPPPPPPRAPRPRPSSCASSRARSNSKPGPVSPAPG